MEFLHLLWLTIAVAGRNIKEYGRVVLRYYTNAQFRRLDIALLRRYLLRNPFRISKNFLVEEGEEDVYTYGETPLTTMAHIAKECSLNSGESVFELGCGRGRTCFWLASFIGCKVVGVEYIQDFIQIAQEVQQAAHLEVVEFCHADMLQISLERATVIYLYGTCYSDAFISRLISRFESLPKGAKVITVSYSLLEYGAKHFALQRCFPAQFTWGVADVYLHVRT